MKLTMSRADFVTSNNEGAIYELYDANEICIYVGQAASFYSRLSAHFKDERWGHLIEEVVIETYPLSELRLQEEKHAWEKKPVFGSRWGFDLRRSRGVWTYTGVVLDERLLWSEVLRLATSKSGLLPSGQRVRFDGKIDNNSH